MKTFVIDSDNNITAYASAAVAEARRTAHACLVTSEAELQAVAAAWPAARLTALWNTLPGVTAVKKFTDRKTGARRIWNAVQSLEAAPEPPPPELPQAGEPSTGDMPHTKKARILALLAQSDGATLQEITSAVGWQAHTVRGFLSGTVGKRMGLRLVSFRRGDGQRAYRVAEQQTQLAPLEADNSR